MAKRIYRELTDDVKKSISDSMKKYHQQMTYDKKIALNNKRSNSLKKYWDGIKSKEQQNDVPF